MTPLERLYREASARERAEAFTGQAAALAALHALSKVPPHEDATHDPYGHKLVREALIKEIVL